MATLAQLLLFRYSSGVIGLEKIGLVVLIQSVLFLTRILDIGAGPNLTRRLAASNVSPNDALFARELWSTVLSICGPTVLISALALLVIVFWPEMLGAVQNPNEVIEIAIAVSVSGIISSVVAILIAAHEGIGDQVARGASMILFGATVLGCGVPLVSNLGTLGYAITLPAGLTAQLIALSLNLIWLGAKIRPSCMRDILTAAYHQMSDNLILNGVSVCRLLFEPLTKYLLFMLGTLEIVAVFDVLNKVVTAVRALVSTMLQPLLFKKSQQHAAGGTVDDSADQRMLESLALYLAAGAIASAPVLEELLFPGKATEDVTYVLVILAVSSAINLSGQIVYLNLLAMAAYGRLLQIHLAMVATNLTVSTVCGMLFGERGVVFGYAATMAFGGVALHLMTPRSPSGAPSRHFLTSRRILESSLVLGVPATCLYLMSDRILTLWLSLMLTFLIFAAFLFNVAGPIFWKK